MVRVLLPIHHNMDREAGSTTTEVHHRSLPRDSTTITRWRPEEVQLTRGCDILEIEGSMLREFEE
jgi:hypothetical protein